MFTPDAFTAIPAAYVRVCTRMAEQQLRVMTVFTRAMLQPNPFFAALAAQSGEERVTPPKATPAPEPRAGRPKAAAAPSRARRKPATPPTMPV
ncbi:hypothetical protein ATO6_09370 [Oceanicola sp. 22II-s10i]|uniref:hypothetical protein n=1 Tax=Oceanicola sp. 22II-s10i TaxID=1317116 RepID=UPI000B522904|nr:hypothetical protein [Oceanicola sp. 22II-s10i]OWU85228.1 hypothetical protein ATO6_09370 [Oceanicola sp. 22II-s10i]